MFSVTITSKSRGVGDQLHRRVVDEQVLEFDIRELAPREITHDLAPEAAGLETFALSTLVTANARP